MVITGIWHIYFHDYLIWTTDLGFLKRVYFGSAFAQLPEIFGPFFKDIGLNILPSDSYKWQLVCVFDIVEYALFIIFNPPYA